MVRVEDVQVGLVLQGKHERQAMESGRQVGARHNWVLGCGSASLTATARLCPVLHPTAAAAQATRGSSQHTFEALLLLAAALDAPPA